MRVQLEKRGFLGAGQVKKGVFTAAHTYTEHICECPPPGYRGSAFLYPFMALLYGWGWWYMAFHHLTPGWCPGAAICKVHTCPPPTPHTCRLAICKDIGCFIPDDLILYLAWTLGSNCLSITWPDGMGVDTKIYPHKEYTCIHSRAAEQSFINMINKCQSQSIAMCDKQGHFSAIGHWWKYIMSLKYS